DSIRHRIATVGLHDDRNRLRGSFESAYSSRIGGHDHISFEANQFGSKLGISIYFIFGKSPVDQDIAAFDVTEITQPLPERLVRRRLRITREISNPRQFFRLLCLGW